MDFDPKKRPLGLKDKAQCCPATYGSRIDVIDQKQKKKNITNITNSNFLLKKV